jgi:anti-sigma factor RsiW
MPTISEQLLAYVEGVLPSEDEPIFREHIATCETCKQEVSDLQRLTTQVWASYRRQRTQPMLALCPEPEALLDFAEGAATDAVADKVKRHLDICAECREQVEMLRAVDGELPTLAAAVAAPPMSAALRAAFSEAYPSKAQTPAVTPVLASKQVSWFARSRRVMGLAASIVVICGMTIFVNYHPERITQAPPSSAPAAPAAPVDSEGGPAQAVTPVTPADTAAASPVQAAAKTAAAAPASSAGTLVASRAPGAAGGGQGTLASNPVDATPPPARDMHRDSFSPPAHQSSELDKGAAEAKQKPAVTVIQKSVARPQVAEKHPVMPVLASVTPVYTERVASTPRPVANPVKVEHHNAVLAAADKHKEAPRHEFKKTESASEPAVQPARPADDVALAGARDRENRKDQINETHGAGGAQMQNGSSTQNANVNQVHDRLEDNHASFGAPGAESATKSVVSSTGRAASTSIAPVVPAAPTAAEVAHNSEVQARGLNSPVVYRGHDEKAANGLRSRLTARGKATVASLLGNNDFTVSVSVTPSEAAELVEARSVRVEVVVPAGHLKVSTEALKSAIMRNLGLSHSRGDEVIVYSR